MLPEGEAEKLGLVDFPAPSLYCPGQDDSPSSSSPSCSLCSRPSQSTCSFLPPSTASSHPPLTSPSARASRATSTRGGGETTTTRSSGGDHHRFYREHQSQLGDGLLEQQQPQRAHQSSTTHARNTNNGKIHSGQVGDDIVVVGDSCSGSVVSIPPSATPGLTRSFPKSPPSPFVVCDTRGDYAADCDAVYDDHGEGKRDGGEEEGGKEADPTVPEATTGSRTAAVANAAAGPPLLRLRRASGNEMHRKRRLNQAQGTAAPSLARDSPSGGREREVIGEEEGSADYDGENEEDQDADKGGRVARTDDARVCC